MAKLNRKWLKNIPQAIYVRKEVMYCIIGFIAIIALVVFWGLDSKGSDASKENKRSDKSDVQNIASSSDTAWARKAAQDAATTTPMSMPQRTQKTQKATSVKSAETLHTESPQNPQNSSQDEALLKDMSAPITANQLTSDNNNSQAAVNITPPIPTSGIGSQEARDDQNMQAEKKAFLQINGQPNLKDDYLGASLQNLLSQYELQAGTIIPGILITGINSDLPGQITGQVRSNVYDSISGKYLLVPQGSKLTGIYDSQTAYGQERVLIAWRRIIFPNGKSIDLQGMPGVDISGYAGFNDQVDNHYFKIFGSVILMSVLSAGAQLSQPQQNSSPFIMSAPTVGQNIAQSLGTNISNTATMLTQKNINIQPTLKIRPGYEFNISVTKDMVFPGAYPE